jgi:hypothetical protein
MQRGSLFHPWKGLISIRGNREQFHLPIPALEQADDIAIRPLGVRALRRPKIDNDNFSAIIA